MLVQTVENNLLLHQLMGKVENIQAKQETNHLVAIALTNQGTIAKVDQLWKGFGNLKFLLWTMGGLTALVPIGAAALTATHFAFGWPR